MVKKKVLVTGGSGYIGARLCLHLAKEGYLVTALCHSKIPDDNEWVSQMDRVIVGDVRNEEFLDELSDYDYEVLIHLVSLDHHQSNSIPSIVTSVNVTPVWSLLDVFSKKGLSKFIYFSTAQVYGILQNEVITENSATDTRNAYGLTHYIGEMLCDYYNRISSIECRVVRLSNSYGAPIFEENNCWWLVVNDLCKMAYCQKKIILQSDGTPLRDFIHGWDLCHGVQAIIETSEPYTTYNLSTGNTFSILEIAKKVQTVYAKRYGIELPLVVTKNKTNSKPSLYKLDNSLIKSIDFEPKWTLEDGIDDLFNYLEKIKK
ncbi:NAD(P)-dependent oxidoreductase [Flavobacterium sp. MMLR14_040]|uniref:NAD-dependent epimerase/dehydratase family protein n=1 Tax=Flavobacterium sp. MMLR14_040 TaxID=3093843 RepID=UPI00299034AB|nr:NAD(P)-dependent oxidoreductase [Flavobacterium sp. MMLR14_040]MDW8849264.1 NAD(P)-dependent oxidoreductase [Flavobacterium sp. MMLR14_040]